MRKIFFILLLLPLFAGAQSVSIIYISNDTAAAIHNRLTALGKTYYFLQDTAGKYMIPVESDWCRKYIIKTGRPVITVPFSVFPNNMAEPVKYHN